MKIFFSRVIKELNDKKNSQEHLSLTIFGYFLSLNSYNSEEENFHTTILESEFFIEIFRFVERR